jgi:hypothetical protein
MKPNHAAQAAARTPTAGFAQLWKKSVARTFDTGRAEVNRSETLEKKPTLCFFFLN